MTRAHEHRTTPHLLRLAAARIARALPWSVVALCACSGSPEDGGAAPLAGPTAGGPAGMPSAMASSGGNAGSVSTAGAGPEATPAGGVPAATSGAGGGTQPTEPGSGTEQADDTSTGSAGGLVDDGLPGRSLVRRLSNAEYAATVQSLLAVTGDYTANFPSDTVVNGFTNNTDVQDVGPALVEQYVAASEAISADAVADVDATLGCALSDGEACVSDFIRRFGKRAWRRPLSDTEHDELLALFQGEADELAGVRVLLQAFLNSPNFLYRAEVGVPVPGEPYSALTSWEIATRLSYFLTGTMPDDALLAAAESDTLTSPEGIETEARRLLATPAARANVADFFSGWLNLRALERLQRDTEQFPDWDSRLPPLFYQETREFATNVVFDGEGNLDTLLSASFTYGDPSLAEFYGGTVGAMVNGLARIDLPPAQRAGLLTQASFLATHSKEIQTDPVSRGKFVRERILCQGIPSPPPDLEVSAPTITPGSTTRERFVQHQADPVCAGCHVLIDPIGLAFEHYDPIGQWRDQEQGRDIDASGDLTFTDVTGPFDGIVEMARKLTESEEVTECFVRYWFRFAFGRGESDSEAARIATITNGFDAADQRVQDLLVALTLTPDFRYLAEDDTAP